MLRVTRQPCLRIVLKSKRMHRAVLQKQFCILSPEVRGLRQWVFTSKLSLAFNVRSCSTQQQPKRESSKRNEVPEGESEIEETRKDTSGLKVREVKTARVPLSRYAATFEKAVALEATKENFYDVVDTFAAKDRTRRGHMEFLKTATEYMEQFNVEKDLTAYNKLLDVFPRGRFKNRTLFDAIWAKQHPQSELALEILTKMEENVLKPSIDTHDILLEVFGHASQPVQKCRRLAYWLTKLEEMFPHPLPQQLPDNEVELSRLAFDRMTKQQMDVVVYQYNSEDEQEFIIGAQSAAQRDILSGYSTDRPLYVEGPYFMWLRRVRKYYFTLRTDSFTQEGNSSEGAVLAVCMTGCQNKEEALRTWISQLQKENPQLGQLSVIFNLQSTFQSVL